jgi:c-di-GMP-binding flagellar brake protein YcgR
MFEPRFDLLDAPANADENCYIDTPAGVISVLRAIAAAGSRAAAYIDNGETFIETSLLDVEGKPAMLVFAKGADEELNSRLLKSQKVTFVTADEGVPVQFSCQNPGIGSHEATEAFRVSVPQRMLRLQRRMYYRLPGEPVHVLLKCEIPCESSDRPSVLRPAVLDLSCGGLAAAIPAAEPLLETGSRTLCELELPGIGKIESVIQVRATSEMTLPDGQLARRYGLEFVNMNNKNVALIQRFILEQQRARKKAA